MRFPAIQKAEDTFNALSHTGRALFLFFAAACILSAGALVYILNDALLVATPSYGGSIAEGIVGSPRFINPILAVSDPDHDLTALIYSGLLKITPDGQYVPDLASGYSVSQDGKTYTFTIRPNATFHDGKPVTAEDVVFTIEKAQDPALKSPLAANWDGVQVREVDAHTVAFTLKSPYAPFIENMTVGILPKHLWQSVSDDEFSFSDLNTSPVGSGPYEASSISRTSSGIPSSYELKAFSKYALGAPYLSSVTLRFYQSEGSVVSALKSSEIDAASGLSPATLSSLKGYNIQSAPLNRVFGVFFNQNQSAVLRDNAVRAALNEAVDRDALVEQVLGGYGAPLTGPLPPSLDPDSPASQTAGSSTLLSAAQQALAKDGWALGSSGILQKTTGKGKTASTQTLEFNLATDNVPELRAAAEYLKETWGKLGVKVDVQIYDQGDLSENVIRPRKYDALLFGEVVGREADLFAFWDSSQRNDPGLNIAMYANTAADTLLGQLRTTADPAARASLYSKFDAQLSSDVPAIFLYAPDFVYIVPNDLQGLNLGFIETPSDRFLSILQWHRQTDYVWPPFAKTNTSN